MPEPFRAKPDAFALYTVLFLHFGGRFLLLQRAPNKRIAPNRWTGVGGKVEAEELGDLRASVLRELEEETNLSDDDLSNLSLRRVLYHNRAGEPLTGLLYYTADLKRYSLPECTEGTLYWKEPRDFAALDIIETTDLVLPHLVHDMQRDPRGQERIFIGVTHYQADGTLTSLSWSA